MTNQLVVVPWIEDSKGYPLVVCSLWKNDDTNDLSRLCILNCVFVPSGWLLRILGVCISLPITIMYLQVSNNLKTKPHRCLSYYHTGKIRTQWVTVFEETTYPLATRINYLTDSKDSTDLRSVTPSPARTFQPERAVSNQPVSFSAPLLPI